MKNLILCLLGVLTLSLASQASPQHDPPDLHYDFVAQADAVAIEAVPVTVEARDIEFISYQLGQSWRRATIEFAIQAAAEKTDFNLRNRMPRYTIWQKASRSLARQSIGNPRSKYRRVTHYS